MNSLAIGEKYNSQISILHLRHLDPSPDPPISLNRFSDRCSDRSFDPRLLEDRSIWAGANRFEIERELHGLDDCIRIDPCCRITCPDHPRPQIQRQLAGVGMDRVVGRHRTLTSCAWGRRSDCFQSPRSIRRSVAGRPKTPAGSPAARLFA